MDNGDAIFAAVFSLALMLGLSISGTLYAEDRAGSINDKDCIKYLAERSENGPNDELENPHGCHEEYVEGAAWWWWGNHTWKYWDDNETPQDSYPHGAY